MCFQRLAKKSEIILRRNMVGNAFVYFPNTGYDFTYDEFKVSPGQSTKILL